MHIHRTPMDRRSSHVLPRIFYINVLDLLDRFIIPALARR